MITRRKLLTVALFIPALPTIVRVSSLMKIVPRPRPKFWLTFDGFDYHGDPIHERIPIMDGRNLIEASGPDIEFSPVRPGVVSRVAVFEAAGRGLGPELFYLNRDFAMSQGDTLVLSAPLVELS